LGRATAYVRRLAQPLDSGLALRARPRTGLTAGGASRARKPSPSSVMASRTPRISPSFLAFREGTVIWPLEVSVVWRLVDFISLHRFSGSVVAFDPRAEPLGASATFHQGLNYLKRQRRGRAAG
jgi:hypothetical protein